MEETASICSPCRMWSSLLTDISQRVCLARIIRNCSRRVPLSTRFQLERSWAPTIGRRIRYKRIARSFAARGVEVIVLRPVFVAYPEMADEIRLRARDPERYRGPMAGRPSSAGGGPLWHHIDARDAAGPFG
jgi:hypothetical protein